MVVYPLTALLEVVLGVKRVDAMWLVIVLATVLILANMGRVLSTK